MIAAGQYDDHHIVDLPSEVGDAQALADALADPTIGRFTVKQLINPRASEMRIAIEDMFLDAGREDTVLLYYGGHGLMSQRNVLFLAATDTNTDRLFSTAVSSTFVWDAVAASRAGHVILIVDSAYAGALYSSEVAVDVASKVVVLASCQQHQAAMASMFTPAVVEGLRSGDADLDGDGEIHAEELLRYTAQWIERRSGHQTPVLLGATSVSVDIARSGRPVDLVPLLGEAIRLARLNVHYSAPGSVLVPREVGSAFNGATLEALANVERHAGSDDVNVTLRQDGETVVVEIVDTGRGFDPTKLAGNLVGIRHLIQNRMAEVGGNALISSARGEGTRVRIEHRLDASLPLIVQTAVESPSVVAEEPDADVDWATDAPARQDGLKRAALADVMAARLREVRRDEPGTSLLVHLDGPWGAGKSSLLNFLGERLADEFTVVRFDAWRQARIAPPWWTLLGATRKEIRRQRGIWAAWWLRTEETFFRARRTGAPYVLAFVLLAAAITAVAFWWPRGTGDPVGAAAKGVAAAIVAIAALWGVSRVVSRFLLWESARGARLFEQSTANPMDEVAAHFGWMLGKSRKPVLFFIDDLDRCQDSYVVELLDSVQTLVRDSGTAAYFVIAADGVWLRTSYEIAYKTFGDAVASPGYPLGHHFLDKLFQLTVPVPAPTTRAKTEFLDRLLRVESEADSERLKAEISDARQRIASSDESGILQVLDNASDAAREDLVATAAVALTSARTRARTEHALRKFLPLLDANPRNVKKFLNTYSVLRSVRVLENNTLPSDALAVWSIVCVRWPAMADYLEIKPEAVRGVINPLWVSECFPEHLEDLARDERFREVVLHSPLTAELIRRCCGAEG